MPEFASRVKGKLAIVAALEREVRPLIKDQIKNWRVSEKGRDGRKFRFFEQDDAVLVCGGIGTAAARRAAEAAIAIYSPALICSAGFAGALDPALKVGDVLQPQRVVNAADCSVVSLNRGNGVLVSFSSVAGAEQKAKLRDSFSAQAVDMEAAAVARAAEAHGIEFTAVKVISDEADCNLPAMDRFIDDRGQFLEWKFAAYTAVRPWLWPSVVRLARNSSKASQALCEHLRQIIADQTALPLNPTQADIIPGSTR
jgi:adenosylhomocysteine nucleosidase